MKRVIRRYFPILILGFLASCSGLTYGQDRRKEEQDSAKYYQKWLNQDILYLITDEERDVFGKLTTAEEKEQFIEQFWWPRDPDLETATNEFREEHYRRIAYVN